MSSDYDVFRGLDVGKGEHHATGLTSEGTRVHDAALPNTEAGLREVFNQLAQYGRVLIVVDQPPSMTITTPGHTSSGIPPVAGVPLCLITLEPRLCRSEGTDCVVGPGSL